MGKMDEQILVVSRDILFQSEELVFQGVNSDRLIVDKIMNNLASNYTVMRRGDAEEDPTYKQPIPYAVIKRGEEIFMYKRLSGGGEARLHEKLSIGVGGHMNAIKELESFQDVLMENLKRELEEELSFSNSNYSLKPFGLINDDEDEVGKVHIGVLVFIDVTQDTEVTVRETDQLSGSWNTIENLLRLENFNKLESWSQIAATAINKQLIKTSE
jgi:predicted NUDIX family phosphoesterase